MKKFISGVVVGALLTVSASVFADEGLEQISAYLRPALPIKLDGNKLELSNPPIIYDGSTYLPLREMAGVFGKEIYWNEAEQTVELGARAGTAPRPTPTPTAAPSSTPKPTPSPTATPGFETLRDYLPPGQGEPALRADGTIYLPMAGGAAKFQLEISWDSQTQLVKFNETGHMLGVSPYEPGVDAFLYKGSVYIKEFFLEDMQTVTRQLYQAQYPPFRGLFQYTPLKAVTTSESQITAVGTLARDDFKIKWLTAQYKEAYMRQMAQEVQASSPSRTLTMSFTYDGITLGWVTVEPNGTTKVTLVENPFGS